MIDEKPTISVTGRCELHVAPDTIVIELSIRSLFDSYDTAYRMSEENLHDLSEIMEKNNLDKKLPKSTYFNISHETRGKYDSNGNYLSETLVGFRLHQNISIEIGMDNILLSSLLHDISDTVTDVTVNLRFTVNDQCSLRRTMLANAVRDAADKAAVMADAAGCSLGPVRFIDYSERIFDVHSDIDDCIGASCNEGPFGITPKDIIAYEFVTVTWFLTPN